MSEDATRVRLVSEREPLLLQAKRLDQANDDFGQSEPVRFAASAFAANGSPVYLYRFSYLQTAMRERLRAGAPHGGEIGYVFGMLMARPGTTLSPEGLAVAGGGLARPVSVPVADLMLLTKIPIVLYYCDNRRRPSSSLGGTSGGRSWACRGCGAMR